LASIDCFLLVAYLQVATTANNARRTQEPTTYGHVSAYSIIVFFHFICYISCGASIYLYVSVLVDLRRLGDRLTVDKSSESPD
jgi:hypothetical protein